MNDITFIKHEKGYWGGSVFCHITEGTFHINALPNYLTNWVSAKDKPYMYEDSEQTLDRLFWSIENLLWYMRNAAQILSHETIHVVISRLMGKDAGQKFDWLERKHNISQFTK